MNHRFTTWTRRVLVALGLALVAFLTTEAPSWAAPASCTTSCSSSGSVSASVNVASSILLSLSASTLDFGSNQAPGSDSSGVPPIVATIGTNDSAGYALSVSATDFNSVIKANNLSVKESASGSLANNLQSTSFVPLVEAGNLILAGSSAMSGPSGDAYTSAWDLHIPANAPGGSASSTITYLAAAN